MIYSVQNPGVSTVEVLKEDQEIVGASGSDLIAGGLGDDTLSGGDGGDTIEGGQGDDVLLGGNIDAVFDPAAATVFRLYQAALGRSPDPVGHQGWIEVLVDGERSLTDIAGSFINSAEFKQVYGNTSDATFVTLLYNNVLDRSPDPAGLENWMNRLDSGTSRATLLASFSESAEFKANVAGQSLQSSFDGYQAGWADDVYRLYQATLGRAPDRAGLEDWTARMADGMTITEAAAGFVNSQEFQNTYGSLNDYTFVEQLYQNVLARGPDAIGLESWTSKLAQGATRGEIVTGFSQSKEFTNKTTAPLAAWMEAQGGGDVLVGGGGHNVLFGGMWADSFVFDMEAGGSHEVVDLEVWDQLYFEGFGYDSAADVRAHLTQVGENVIFSDQGVSVSLSDTSLDMLEDDSLFVF